MTVVDENDAAALNGQIDFISELIAAIPGLRFQEEKGQLKICVRQRLSVAFKP